MMHMHDIEIKNMLEMAKEARSRAYAPYSNFRVGACLKAASGAYYMGCNMENASYSATVCAERVAMGRAICERERQFDALAICWDGVGYAVPCGVCRQLLSEFCDGEMPVICATKDGEYKVVAFGELMPAPFRQEDLR